MLTDREKEEMRHKSSEPLHCDIEGEILQLLPKVFKTGSFGWHGQAKITYSDTRIQANVVLTVIGSRPGYVPPDPSKFRQPDAASLNGEQVSPALKNDVEAPPEHSPLFPEGFVPRKRGKRSKG